MNTSRLFMFFVFSISALCVNAQDLNENLLIHYDFDGNFQDQSSNQFHGSQENVGFTEDRFGVTQNASYYFGSSCLEFPNNPILKPDFPFSISVWVNPEVENIRAEGIVGTDQFLDNYFGAFISILADGKLMVGYGDGCGSTGPACRISEISEQTFVNNRWYHIAAIFESSSHIDLYINGCKEDTEASGTGTEELKYSDEPGAIGKKDHSDIASNPIGFYHGAIDDFYYWDRILNEQDVAKLVDNFFQNGNSELIYQGCQNDGYFEDVNGTIYNENNPIGFEVLNGVNGCDSIVSVFFEFLPNEDVFFIETICDDPTYSLEINNNVYDINNPIGIEPITNLNGCIANQYIELLFGNSSFEKIEYEGCEGDVYMVEVNDTIYNIFHPTGFQYLTTEAGCDSTIEIDLKFNTEDVFNYEEIICDNPSYTIVINDVEYSIDKPQGTEILTNQFGCDSTNIINLIFANSSVDTFEYIGCEGDDFAIEFNGQLYDESNPTGQEQMLTHVGCDSIINVRLLYEPIIECDLFLPNVITKNAPFPNNSFQLFADPDCTWSFDQIHIFDRWGNRVFSSKEQNFTWEGNYKGSEVSSGVYTYVLDYATKQKRFSKTGTITFIRD